MSFPSYFILLLGESNMVTVLYKLPGVPNACSALCIILTKVNVKLLFIPLFVWAVWVFAAVCRRCSSCLAWLHIALAPLLWSTGSTARGLSSCSSQALENSPQESHTGSAAPRQVGFPGPGIEPVSPALAGGLADSSPLSHQGSLAKSVQFLTCVQLFATPWTAACQASASITNSRGLLKLPSIESVMPSNHLILCRPLLLLPSIPPSIRVFSNETVLRMRWPKYQSFSLSISPSNEHLGLISFKMDWLDLLAVQGTLKSLLQHHSSKALILRCSALFTVQLSLPYMTTGKTIALTRRTFVGKVKSLLFNMLSRFVITFLPRSKCLFISWLQSPSAVILEPKKNKV